MESIFQPKKKLAIIIYAILLLLILIALLYPNKPKPVDKSNSVDTYLIDSLTLKLKREEELNNLYQERIANLEFKLDSINSLIQKNSIKIADLKKKKKDERNVDYSSWTNNEFTKFLSKRYHNN
jgi:hypothetical protein